MTVTLNFTVEDVNEKLVLYDRIELQRSTEASTGFSAVTSITFVEDQIFYEYDDVSGSLTSWYRYRFSDGGVTLSDFTNPFRVEGVDRKKIRQTAIENYRAGMVLSVVESTEEVITFSDYRVKSSAYETGRAVGSFMEVVSGNSAGVRTVVVDSSPSDGTLTVNPELSTPLEENDEVELHWLIEPHEWNLAINRALKRYHVVERIPITGDGNVEFSLSSIPWLTSRGQIVGVWYSPSTNLPEVAFGSSGRWWGTREDMGAVTFLARPALDATQTVYIEALRSFDELYTDDSVAPSTCDVELAAALAYDEVLKALTMPATIGRAHERLAWRQARADHQPTLKRLIKERRPRPRWQAPPRDYPTSQIIQPWGAR